MATSEKNAILYPKIVMSKKPGRNDPCPCGSGKKYKKCCLSKHAAAAPNKAASPQTHSGPQQRPATQPLKSPPVVSWDDDDDLDELSNSVVDLIREGKLDEAEKACDELDRRFPEMIDCLERRAILLEARGEIKLAAEYYRRAAEYARTHDGFEPESIDAFLASANKLDPHPDTQGT